jgi:hypothetical protein
MNEKETIFYKLSKLPKEKQNEVIDFIDFLSNKNTDIEIPDENIEWSKFSMAHAIRGLEDEPDLYTLEDLKEKF